MIKRRKEKKLLKSLSIKSIAFRLIQKWYFVFIKMYKFHNDTRTFGQKFYRVITKIYMLEFSLEMALDTR